MDPFDVSISAHSGNLNTYIGQTVMLQIRAETDASDNSNLMVDDVSLQTSALLSAQFNNTIPVLNTSIVAGKAGIIPWGVLP